MLMSLTRRHSSQIFELPTAQIKLITVGQIDTLVEVQSLRLTYGYRLYYDMRWVCVYACVDVHVAC